MLFEEIFFDNSDLQKFNMYRTLKTIDNYGFTINDLSVYMHVSYQQAYNLFHEMIMDINEVTGKTTKTPKKRVLSPESFPISVDEYRVFLLEQSVAFQFIDYLFQSSSASVDKFCRDRFISRSTLTRKTAALRQLMGTYGIKIAFNPASINGDERQIRLFLFRMYWFGYHGVSWPLLAIPTQQISKEYSELTAHSSSAMLGLQEMIFWGVCRIRIARGYTVGDMGRFDELFASSEEMNVPIYSQAQFPKLSDTVLQDESRFFHLLRSVQFRFETISSGWMGLYTAVMTQDNPVQTYVKQLLDYLEQFWRPGANLGIGDNMVLTTNIIRVATSYYVLGGNYPKALDFLDANHNLYPHSVMYEKLLDFHEQLPPTTEFEAFRDNAEELSRALSFLLSPFLQMFVWDQLVHCRVILDNGGLNSLRVAKILRNMCFVTLLQEDDDIGKADLIVTSSDNEHLFNINDTDHTVIVWHEDATTYDFFNLYLVVKDIFMKKMNIEEYNFV